MERGHYVIAACVAIVLIAVVLIVRSRKQSMQRSPQFDLAPLDAVLARPYECGMAWMWVRSASGAPATQAYAAALDAAVRRRPASSAGGAFLLAAGDDRLVVQAMRVAGRFDWSVVDDAVRMRVDASGCSVADAPAGARVFSAVLAE